MAKKNKQKQNKQKQNLSPSAQLELNEQPDQEHAAVEHAYIIKKLSLSEYQIVDVELQGSRVVSRKEREPNVSSIVMAKLFHEISRNE